jgi:hypothetical protein
MVTQSLWNDADRNAFQESLVRRSLSAKGRQTLLTELCRYRLRRGKRPIMDGGLYEVFGIDDEEMIDIVQRYITAMGLPSLTQERLDEFNAPILTLANLIDFLTFLERTEST